jgi:hypothetical protein
MTTVESLLKDGLRTLFCFGLTQEFFNADTETRNAVGAAIKDAFDDLEGRFGVKVLGTYDDDLLQCGPTPAFPWISYILADVPDMEAAVAVTNLVRTPFRDHRLVKYMRVEARMGHKLFFGNR